MARSKSASGEQALFRIGSAKTDLLDFPEAVKERLESLSALHSLVESIARRSRGREQVPEFSKS